MLAALIGKHQSSGKNADQQIIDHRRHATDTQFVQPRPQSDAEKKDSAAQAKTVDGPELESDRFPVHRAPIISQWIEVVLSSRCGKKFSSISASSNCFGRESAFPWPVPAAPIRWRFS